MTNCKNEIKCGIEALLYAAPKFVRKKQLLKIECMEGFVDPLTEMLTLPPSPGWGSCPFDVLLSVFEHLSPKDLMSCIQVNNWWRDAVDYMGKVRFILKFISFRLIYYMSDQLSFKKVLL